MFLWTTRGLLASVECVACYESCRGGCCGLGFNLPFLDGWYGLYSPLLPCSVYVYCTQKLYTYTFRQIIHLGTRDKPHSHPNHIHLEKYTFRQSLLYLSVQLGSVPCSWANIFQLVLYSLNIQSLLKAKQHNTLKSSKITIYFQRTETKEKEPANSNTNEGEVILVDWATFFCTPVDHDCNSHLFTLHHNWFVL